MLCRYRCSAPVCAPLRTALIVRLPRALNCHPVVPRCGARSARGQTLAVYRQTGAGRSLGSEDGHQDETEPEEVVALRRSLFALENERDDVLRIGEASARNAVKLKETVDRLEELAIARMRNNDENGARAAVREKADTVEQMEKNSQRAQANFTLASKIVQKIGVVQMKLRNLGVPVHKPAHKSPAPSAPTTPSAPPQPSGWDSYQPPQVAQPPQWGYNPPAQQPPYQAQQWDAQRPQQPYVPPTPQYGTYQQPQQPYMPPQQPSSPYPDVPKYEPVNPAGSTPHSYTPPYDHSHGSSSSSSSSTSSRSTSPDPRGYSYNPAFDSSSSAPGSAGGSAPPSPGSPLSPDYKPPPPKWQQSLAEAQKRMQDSGIAAPKWQMSLEEAQKRIREAESLGNRVRVSAEDKVFEAQERLRAADGRSVESMFEQRGRMRSTSEDTIKEAQERLRNQDAEILGYARRVVERYKKGEYVSDEQLEFAFRQLERLNY